MHRLTKVHAFVIVGIGELLRGFLATAALFCRFYLYRIAIGHSFDQTSECIALRRNVCCQFRNQDQADAYSDPVVYGIAYCDYDCLLRADLLYRAGGPACRTFDVGSSNHKMLVPVTLLTGSCIALLCNLLMVLPGTHNILPLNAVTPMLGAPVIIM